MFSPSNSEFEGRYDIFLCFRGLDTRKKFIDHLYKALKIEGYQTFKDDNEIERGENIKSELRKAIKNSRISVVVLSKNYADSVACLFELQTILEHRKTSDHIMLPVFYDVDPSEIREQAEKLDFGKKKVTVKEVKGWSVALKEVANTAGMVSQNQSNGYESKLIEDIVEFIRMKVGYNLLHNLSKSGKQFLKPGFLAYQKQTHYARKRNKKVKANDRRLKVMGFKHNTTSFRVSVHSNGNGKRIRADLGDGDYSPFDGEDDSDDDSVGSFEEEAIEIPEKQPRISDLQQAPSRYQREANTISDKVTRSTPNSDVVTQLPPALDAELQIEAASVVKRGRGVTRGFEVQRRLKTEGKIKGVIFDEDKWLPVGPAEKIFKMEIGILTRLLAPLHVFYWKRVTAAQKAPLFERLESEFDVKFEDPHTKNVVDKIMAMRFRQFKHRCHLHYKKFSPEEAPQYPPVNVEPLDWIPLCEHFKTDDFKKQSKAGIENRGELEVNHTSGSKSFIQRLYEMENSQTGEDSETQEEPSQVNLYKETHLKKDGTWVHPRAAENYEKMEMLKNQPEQEGGNKKTEDEIREDVLKTKIGYARGLGYGVKPSKSTSRGASTRLLARRLEEADRRAEEAERRAQECQEELQAQRNTITKLEESQLELQQAFKTIVARFGGRSP